MSKKPEPQIVQQNTTVDDVLANGIEFDLIYPTYIDESGQRVTKERHSAKLPTPRRIVEACLDGEHITDEELSQIIQDATEEAIRVRMSD